MKETHSSVRTVWKGGWMALWLSLFILASAASAEAIAEPALFWESEAVGGFVQKKDDHYIPLFSPTSDTVMGAHTRSGWYVPDGIFGVGFERHMVSSIFLNQKAGALCYDLYKNKQLSGTYEDLSAQFLSYSRQDILMDVNWQEGAWALGGGVQFIEASQLVYFALQDGTASRVEGNELPLDVQGRYALWKGYANDRGHGLGYHFTLQYQPSQQFVLKLSGYDLGGWLMWRNIDEYHGTVNLDLVREEHGVDYVYAPLEGIYVPDGFLRVPLTPTWRGELAYNLSSAVQIHPWLQYRAGWELGVQGAFHRADWPVISLGVAHSQQKWNCQVGVKWSWLALEGGINLPGPVTDYRLGVRVGEF